MPRGDRTGPNGMGSKTGRNLGYCVGNNQAGFENNTDDYSRGRGFAGGNRNRGNNYSRGMGFGFRHGFNLSGASNLVGIREKTLIENEINTLKDQLDNLETKLKTLKNE